MMAAQTPQKRMVSSVFITLATPSRATPRTPTGTQPGKPVGTLTGTQTGQPAGTLTGTQTGQPAGKLTGTQTGQPVGTLTGTQTGQPAGTLTGTQTGQPAGTLTGTQTGQPAGTLTGTQTGKQAGTLTGINSKYTRLNATTPSSPGAVPQPPPITTGLTRKLPPPPPSANGQPTAGDNCTDDLPPPPPPEEATLTQHSTPPPPPPSLYTPVPPVSSAEMLHSPPAPQLQGGVVGSQHGQGAPPGGDKQVLQGQQHIQSELLDCESKELCGFCRKSVPLASPAIEAMNRTYHPACFLCRQCRHPLAGELYYNKAGTPLCEPCYQATLEQCGRCGQVIQDQVIRALDKAFHPACFTCVVCSQPIGAERFAVDDNNELHCLLDYYRRFASRCCVCEQLIIPAPDGRDLYTVECLGRSFHEACYCCQVCGVQLSPEPTDQGCFPLDDRILCKPCHINLAQQSTP